MTDEPSAGISRRGFLGRLGVGGLATAAGGAFLWNRPASPAGGADYGTVSPDSEPVAESDQPYAVWQYRRSGEEFESTLPINVVCPLACATVGDLLDVFREAGWYSNPEEYVRYAWDRETEEYKLQEWSAAETNFGHSGRHHVRCWETDATASIQAHVDTRAAPGHSIASHADAQRGVEGVFENAGWTVETDALDFRNDSGPDHDGLVSVLRGGES